MKKRVIPIIISLILSISIVTVAWMVQDAKVDGVTIKTSGDGIELFIKKNESSAKLGTSVTLNVAPELIPCAYDGNFKDRNGEVVNNDAHRFQQEVLITSLTKCNLQASVKVTGSLPVKVVLNGTETSSTLDMGVLESSKVVVIQYYVDGELCTESGEANVEITFHGEKI